jgi:hypothetical protein
MRRSKITRKSQTAIRVHPGLLALKGALASTRGKGLSFAQIRAAAARVSHAPSNSTCASRRPSLGTALTGRLRTS